MIRRPPGRHWRRPPDIRRVDFNDLSIRDIARFGVALGIRFHFDAVPLSGEWSKAEDQPIGPETTTD